MEVPKDLVINVSKDTPLEEGCFRPSDKAKPGCKYCYGRGIVAENLTTKSLIICRCVEKQLKKEEKERQN